MTGDAGKRFLLVYGSQTGQAQAICEEIADHAPQHGLWADLHCLSHSDKKFSLEREKLVVIVVSTTGDGEVPDTAQKFWRRLKKTTLPSTHLKQLQYTLLGLGDSNYTSFCFGGKMIDKRLQELGATQFYPSNWADDAAGLDVVADPWIEGVFVALIEQLKSTRRTPQRHLAPTRKISGKFATSNLTKTNVTQSTDSTDSLTNNSEVKDDSPSSSSQNNEIKDDSPSSSSQNNEIKDDSPSSSSQNNEIKDDSPSSSSQNNEVEVASLSLQNNEVKTDSSSIGSQNNDIKNASASLSLQNTEMKNDSTSLRSQNGDIKNNSPSQSLQNIEVKNYSTIPELQNNDKKVTSGGSSEKKSITTPTTGQFSDACSAETSQSDNQPTASLSCSVPPLSESPLSLPVLSPPYMKISYEPDLAVELACIPVHNGASLPSAQTSVTMATVTAARQLTSDDAVKSGWWIELHIQEAGWSYEAGDAFGVICPNSSSEVDTLLDRLGLRDQANMPYKLSIMADTKKRNAAIPAHVPAAATLRHTFTTCCDIRCSPKKALLRTLVEYTSDEAQRRRLQELASKQGAEDYSHYVREAGISILDLLLQFPSCQPPVERLLELLPRLQPRAYSVCSSPLVTPGKIAFVFNVVEFPQGEGRTAARQGVCTGWLADLGRSRSSANLVEDKLRDLQLQDLQIPVYLRSNQHFRAPADLSVPVIMIGPGTGVAPFVGFLHDRSARLKQADCTAGETWLFFGCRHQKHDYLFREEFQTFVTSGVLSHLFVSFSRDPAEGSARYVQDNLHLHGGAIYQLLAQGAKVYVCGDAKNMAKSVTLAFVDIIAKHKGVSSKEAEGEIMQLKLHKRYLEDVWT